MADNRTCIRRFPPVHRLWHFGLLLVFMVLSVTGIAWMYFETPWGRGLADRFGVAFEKVLMENGRARVVSREKLSKSLIRSCIRLAEFCIRMT